MLRVYHESYDDLSKEEKELMPNNGWGKEYANYIRITHGVGKTIFLTNDAIEPEDKSFKRDLKPLINQIERAYLLGVKDGKRMIK